MKKVFLIGLFLLSSSSVFFLVVGYSKPQMNKLELTTFDHYSEELSVRVALLSDLHIRDNKKSIVSLMERVRSENPDVILLAGDYIFDGSAPTSQEQRQTIANVLAPKNEIPVIAVLGNHEEWSNSQLWINAFRKEGIVVLNNQVEIFNDFDTCIRGLGDAFTNQFEYIDFPSECNNQIRLTLTHDPAGAFNDKVKGIVFSGHTHCGQISIPFFGPIVMPTEAPAGAQCGLYEDKMRKLYVTSGVGMSVLPFRFMTQAGWELITITTNK